MKQYNSPEVEIVKFDLDENLLEETLFGAGTQTGAGEGSKYNDEGL